MPHRILIAALASPGFVFSSLAVAERARAAGHEVAFVTDVSYADAVEARGFARIRRGRSDGPSFGLDGWGRPLHFSTGRSGWRVWSSGPDGVDDAGEGDDLVVTATNYVPRYLRSTER